MSVRLGLLLGDPCGIGPELVAKLLAGGALEREVATVVIGEPRILARGALPSLPHGLSHGARASRRCGGLTRSPGR